MKALVNLYVAALLCNNGHAPIVTGGETPGIMVATLSVCGATFKVATVDITAAIVDGFVEDSADEEEDYLELALTPKGDEYIRRCLTNTLEVMDLTA